MRLPPSACLLTLVCLCFGRLVAEELPWPGVEYSYAKGYFYVPQGSSDQSILRDGRLNAGIERIAALSAEDISEIQEAFVRPLSKWLTSQGCYSPHHAFIFFDSTRRPVAHLELCFTCSGHRVSPPLAQGRIVDYNRLSKLCAKLGLPQFEDFRRTAEPPALLEEVKRQSVLAAHGEALSAAELAKASPPMEHAWPWRPFAKVKVCLFNELGGNPYLVHLGVPNASISKTLELSKEQQERVWTAFTAETRQHQRAPGFSIRFEYLGTRYFFIEGLGRFPDLTRDSAFVRRGG
jgi:hypothetical protein